MIGNKFLSVAGASEPTDAQFNYVTMLLHGDGTNGAQNNTFTDSSTNNFTITRNGNTTQGSFTPYGPTWSNNFTGSNYLNTISSANLGMGTGDFTIEAWIYVTSAFSGYQTIFGDGNTTGAVFFGNTPAGFGLRSVSVGNILVTTAPSINTWVHVAICRSGSSNRLFYNGVQQSTTVTDSTNFATQSGYVGGDNGGSNFIGYISNLRVVKGTALYTSNFNPSTAPLTAVTNTQLLTCQSNRFIDNSSNTFSFTVTGSPTVQRFSPFAPQYQYTPAVIGGSGYFDGSGDYLLTPATGQFAPAGDFTIGVWVYPTAFNSYNVPIANFTTNASTDWEIEIPSNGSIAIYTNGSTARISAASGTVKLNQWQYIAIARSGSTITAYYNGASFGTYSQSGTFGSATKAIAIGAQPAAGGSPFAGYISDVLLIDGSAVTSVPSTPSTAISGTSLLLNFTNAGIYDNAMMNDLETVGNAQISTSVKKYGTGSIAFDGTGDYLYSPSSNTALTGVFTIEFWLYVNSLATTVLYSTSERTSLIALLSTGKIEINVSTSPQSTATLSTGSWNHLAFTRDASGNWKYYLNGVDGGLTLNDTGTYTLKSIAARYTDAAYSLNGYIDDLRITKGYARYTSTFTPPTSALADKSSS